MRIYAIGDIHGQLEMLKAAHARIDKDRARVGDQDARIVHLGDLTDRGPDSKGVIQYLIDGIAGGAPWAVIKGNHDKMFLGHLAGNNYDTDVLAHSLTWLNPRLGGDTTLASYGVKKRLLQSAEKLREASLKAVPETHITFLENLPLTHQTDDLLFVHAGIRPGVPVADQDEEDLIWIRKPFLEDTTDHGRLIVHGHTPVGAATHYGNRVNLDTGAGYGDPLTAAVFEGRRCWAIEDAGRIPLDPMP
jgi:serine/threonine protein phosphatase 1